MKSTCQFVGSEPDALALAREKSQLRNPGGLVFFLQDLADDRCWLLGLDETEVVIGRAPEADLVVADSTVSGQHVRLSRSGPSVELEDIESTNGSFANERRVQNHTLAHGDILRLGSARLRVVLEGIPKSTQSSEGDGPEEPTTLSLEKLIKVVRPQGVLAGAASRALVNAARPDDQKQSPFVIVDLSKTDAVSNNALLALETVRAELRELSGDLALCTLNSTICDTLNVSGLVLEFEDVIFADLASARQAMAKRLAVLY